MNIRDLYNNLSKREDVPLYFNINKSLVPVSFLWNIEDGNVYLFKSNVEYINVEYEDHSTSEYLYHRIINESFETGEWLSWKGVDYYNSFLDCEVYFIDCYPDDYEFSSNALEINSCVYKNDKCILSSESDNSNITADSDDYFDILISALRYYEEENYSLNDDAWQHRINKLLSASSSEAMVDLLQHK